MSIVEILSHDETIYDVEKKEEAKIQKPPMYVGQVIHSLYIDYNLIFKVPFKV